MRVSTIVLSLLAFTAPIAGAQAQTAAEPYRAIGTEPFWSVTLDGKTIRFEAPGKPVVTVASPRPIIGFNGERYETRRVLVDITHVPCSDGMSDRTYHDTVMVRIGDVAYRGCGGESAATPAQASVLEGQWRITAIHGRPVSPDTNPVIRFEGSRISGNASCNNFNGSFRFTRGRLTTGPVATTRRFCERRVQNVQEANVLALLGQRLSVSSYRSKLVLTGTKGQTMVLERNDRARIIPIER